MPPRQGPPFFSRILAETWRTCGASAIRRWIGRLQGLWMLDKLAEPLRGFDSVGKGPVDQAPLARDMSNGGRSALWLESAQKSFGSVGLMCLGPDGGL